MWQCKAGGKCTFAIPANTAIICVCASKTFGMITDSDVAKLEQIESLRIQREINKASAKLVKILNEEQ